MKSVTLATILVAAVVAQAAPTLKTRVDAGPQTGVIELSFSSNGTVIGYLEDLGYYGTYGTATSDITKALRVRTDPSTADLQQVYIVNSTGSHEPNLGFTELGSYPNPDPRPYYLGGNSTNVAMLSLCNQTAIGSPPQNVSNSLADAQVLPVTAYASQSGLWQVTGTMLAHYVNPNGGLAYPQHLVYTFNKYAANQVSIINNFTAASDNTYLLTMTFVY